MSAVLTFLGSGSRSLSFFLGAAVIGVALAVATTDFGVGQIAVWALQVFGVTFLTIFGTLVLTVVVCWHQLIETHKRGEDPALWLESGLHAANGVATIALTYTLLGISLGIGTLADQPINADTVQIIIGSLTEHFSLAFMTTVVGLPASAVLKALILITETKMSVDEKSQTTERCDEIPIV